MRPVWRGRCAARRGRRPRPTKEFRLLQRLFLDVENPGCLRHRELLEVPLGEHLAIDPVHGIERRPERELSFGPGSRFARAGQVSQQLTAWPAQRRSPLAATPDRETFRRASRIRTKR
jgi:hypothetical protein